MANNCALDCLLVVVEPRCRESSSAGVQERLVVAEGHNNLLYWYGLRPLVFPDG